MEYGLQASLYSVSEAFSRILNDKTLDKEKIYKEIAFINKDGQLLSGVSSQESKLKDEHDLSHLLAPELSDATILVDPDKQNQDVLLSIAYYYKQSYQGQIVAWVSAQPVYKHLVKETSSTSRRTIYIVSNYGSLNLPSDVQQTLNQYKMRSSSWEEFPSKGLLSPWWCSPPRRKYSALRLLGAFPSPWASCH
jgi:hypothetical protein